MAKPKAQPHDPWGHLLKNGAKAGNPTLAPRCGALNRAKMPCRGPAMKNGRCRLHGGKSTGPRTPEGRERLRQAVLKHGEYTQKQKKFLSAMRKILKREGI